MTTRNLHFSQKPLSRDQYLQVVGAGLAARQNPFARQAILHWLATYPGDLLAGLYYAHLLVSEGRLVQVLPVLQGLCIADPEFTEAVELLLKVVEHLQNHREVEDPRKSLIAADSAASRKRLEQLGALENSVRAQWFALVGQGRGRKTLAAWGGPLWYARQALGQGDLTLAHTLLHDVLEQEPAHPLAAVTHLQLLAADPNIALETKYETARAYHQTWADCLPVMLYLAKWCMESGQSDLAVALLHQAASRDVGGQVVRRLWGAGHLFRSLWPERLELELDLIVPAEVTARLGWNRLSAGDAPLVEQDQETGRAAVNPSASQVIVEDPGIAEAASVIDEPAPVNAEPTPVIAEPAALLVEEVSAAPAAKQASVEKPVEAVQVILQLAEDDKADVPLPAPAEISKIKVDRRKTRDHTLNGEIQAIEDEIESLAARLNLSGVTRQDGRFPIYVIFSTRSRLQAVYGAQIAGLLEGEMEQLAETVRNRPGWGARVFFADDPVCTLQVGTKPAKPDDPWELKLTLTDLDDTLAKRGERIGALLIVGGPEIVPFHCLPNPVDDQDNDIPSDNPYATRDENFFIPEWPVGRLPGGAGNDARLMLDALQRFQATHAAYKRRLSLRKRLQRWLVAQLEKFRLGGRRSFGYTAAIWKNAAASVFQPIGKPGWLYVSPPSGVGTLKSSGQHGKPGASGGVPKPVGRLGYFNLHGLVDAPEWFGHRDLMQSSDDEVDYPVAFRPQDVQSGSPLGDVPKVIFSEACYGMHIQNRVLDEAIALKFLEAGSLAIAGSTCMAYGSYGAMDNSLVAADLLGHSFWRFLKEGMPAGEALRQAKIYLASEMDHRQGYLDGLDQKTLISFVLYGDPLADPLRKGKIPKSIRYRVNPVVEMHTICERLEGPGATGPVPVEMMDAVRQAVAKYLPGMSDARVAYVCEQEGCDVKGRDCSSSQIKSPEGKDLAASRNAGAVQDKASCPDGIETPLTQVFHSLVTLSKQVRRSGEVHPEIARLTLDEQGKLVKLVVSR
jgi:hypothetical protein